MANHTNYSIESRNIKEGSYENFDSSLSYDPANQESIDYEEWSKFLSYYRYYVDKFATDVLGLRLFNFQKLILRAMARHQNSMFIASRGLGKSYLTAVYFICCAILYPKIKCGIASGTGNQSRMIIIQKIKGELVKNENIAREIIFPIKTGQDDCCVTFKNGSEIRAITLGQNTGGDSARGWRFNYVLIDEARLVKDDIIEEILIPMTKTKRKAAIDWNKPEKGKLIYISSAYLKTSNLYKRFKYHYNEMVKGSKDYYACCLPYQVGVQAGIFQEEDILKERDKPTMTSDKFSYEYEAMFVGSSNASFFPYELTSESRVLKNCELEQPKKSKSEYIIVHDVAISDAKGSDNASTHVIKLKLKSDGTYYKEVVYSRTHNGMSLPKQMEFIRQLYHLRFPNAIKIVIDQRGNGEPLPSLFYSVWEYKNDKGETIEFPPLVLDNDDEGKRLTGAVPILRGITATGSSNNTMYTYLKSCFENNTLRLLVESNEVDGDYKAGLMQDEEFQSFVQHDLLISELSNIKQTISEKGNNILYERIISSQKRDRATSLAYGLSVVLEMEEKNRRNLLGKKSIDWSKAPKCVSTVSF